MTDVVRVATIGMGGFAASHHGAIEKLEVEGRCRLVCTCDPDPSVARALADELCFESRGVAVYDNYLRMLDHAKGDLDVVTVPTPVPLHAEMHAACVQRGLAVYLEKPPTLDYRELEAMLDTERRATRLTNVGFNYIVEPPRQALKARLLAGEFGTVRKVCFSGLWPRPLSYYQRTFWAGRLVHNGRLVLDSCMGNAMAHHVHNVLFWAGTGELFSWAEVAAVEAELYRAHAIESADTVFARATTASGIELRLAMSHACAGRQHQCEWVMCDDATLYYDVATGFRIVRGSTEIERGEGTISDPLERNFAAYFDYLEGKAERPMTRLVDSIPFVSLCDLVFVAASRIHTVPDAFATRLRAQDENSEYIAINGLNSVVDRFLADDLLPSEQRVDWAAPGGRATASQVGEVASAVARMRPTT